MTVRIDVPGGDWVELRDVMDVTYGERMDIVEAAAGDTRFWTVDHMAVGLLLAAWSFETPPPGSGMERLRAIGELPLPIVAALLKDPAIIDARHAVFPELAPDPDPASPTPPSGD